MNVLFLVINFFYRPVYTLVLYSNRLYCIRVHMCKKILRFRPKEEEPPSFSRNKSDFFLFENVEFNKYFIRRRYTSFRECIQSIDLKRSSLEWITMWKLGELYQHTVWNKTIDNKTVVWHVPARYVPFHALHIPIVIFLSFLYDNGSRSSWWKSSAFHGSHLSFRWQRRLSVKYEMSNACLLPYTQCCLNDGRR